MPRSRGFAAIRKSRVYNYVGVIRLPEKRKEIYLYAPVGLPYLQVEENKKQKHTTGGIPRWSPTLVLVARFSAYVWQSGRDAQFSLTYGRMCSEAKKQNG